MPPVMIPFLVFQALAFAGWAWCMYRALFRLSGRAVERAQSLAPGPRAQLAVLRDFLQSPEHARDRRAVGWSSLALLAAIIAFALARAVWG